MKGFLKTIMVLIVLAVVGGVLYLFVFDGENPFTGDASSRPGSSDGLSFDSGAGDVFSNKGNVDDIEIDTASVVSMFNGVSAIELDGSILSSRGFRDLLDFSVPISLPRESGRVNPFLPIGVNQATSASARSATSLTGVTATEATEVTEVTEVTSTIEVTDEDASAEVDPSDTPYMQVDPAPSDF